MGDVVTQPFERRQTASEGYDPPDRHIPSSEFLRLARLHLPDNWNLTRSSYWFQLTRMDAETPPQGWKIHVSSRPGDAATILDRVLDVCIPLHAPLKFLADFQMFRALAGKGVPRGSAGKFITIYPHDETLFIDLLERLYIALSGFVGPYVLGDRRFRDCRVLYYRYGTLDPKMAVTTAGTRKLQLIGPDGQLVEDARLPYWNPPPWVRDPVAAAPIGEDEAVAREGRQISLKGGQYSIKRAMSFSVSGGVYLAYDRCSRKDVVIKEARPWAALDNTGSDAIARLLKEHRLLTRLQGSHSAPEPIDLFPGWEHMFLCEELLQGCQLATLLDQANPRLAHVSASQHSLQRYAWFLCVLWINICEVLERLHDRGIVFGDLSPWNVFLVAPDHTEVRFIDFEAALEVGVDHPTGLATPGFASPSQMSGSPIDVPDDYYSLGAVMLASMWPVTRLAALDYRALTRVLHDSVATFELSEAVGDVVQRLLSADPQSRPTPREVAGVLRGELTELCSPAVPFDPQGRRRACSADPGGALGTELRRTVNRVVANILESATPRRHDRLFPAERVLFETNSLSFAHGATGVLYALTRVGVRPPDELVGWVLAKPLFRQELYPPGLYIGLSGIAWVLATLELDDLALKAVAAAAEHPLLYSEPDLMYGCAGFGLTCLYLYLRTGERYLLGMAQRVGTHLLESAVPDEYGCHWKSGGGRLGRGYLRGNSGIALFLLYLALATGQESIRRLGERALDSDCAACISDSAGRYSFHSRKGGPVVGWGVGTAGVASVVLRYSVALQAVKYQQWWGRLVGTLMTTECPSPHLFQGTAGVGNVLLDGSCLLGRTEYIVRAEELARGILAFVVDRGQGATFPGSGFNRASVSVASGSSGIMLFLDRVQRRSRNFDLALDGLLEMG